MNRGNYLTQLSIRLSKLSLGAACLILVACGDPETKEPESTSPSEAVLEQHFYSDQDDSTTLGEVAQAKPEPPLTSTEKDNIVVDMGFSGVEEPLTPEQDSNNIEEKYCLAEEAIPAASYVCDKVSKRLASVSLSMCSQAKLMNSGCESVNGFPIVYSEFAPLAERVPQGKILVLGGTHGDELTSVSVMFRWIEKLNKHHSGLFHWHMVPVVNPDGLLKKHASRTNQNGVDLNRNMPSDDWHENAIDYWTHKGGKNPRKFPGDSPASEPEVQWLIDKINDFDPHAIISVHAPYGVVDFDSQLLNTAPKSLGKLHLNLLGTYPGSLGNYAGINRNIPVITLELPHAWEMPSRKESTRIWEDIVVWLKRNVQSEEYKAYLNQQNESINAGPEQAALKE